MTILKIGDESEEVKELCEMLKKKKLLRTISSTYTTEVRRAVKVFQSNHVGPRGLPLVVDGIAGPLTLWALRTKDITTVFDSVPIHERFYEMPEQEPRSKLAGLALELAIGELKEGAKEEKAKNSGPFVAKYHQITERAANARQWAWAGVFISWCFKQAGKKLRHEIPFKYSASPHEILKNCRRKNWGYALQDETPQPGDLAVWIRAGMGWKGHIGIVYEVADGILYLIEADRGEFPASVRVYAYVLNGMDGILGFARIPDRKEWR